MSAFADRGEHVRLVTVLSAQPGWRDATCGRVPQLAEAAQRGHVPEVGHVEQAVDLVELALVDLQRVAQPFAKPRAHPAVDLEPDHLAEAAAAELLLHRLKKVVGLVGDVVVGVAGDPEEGIVGHLHAREERLQVGGDQVLERDQRRARLADRDEPPEQLLRHLDPSDHLGSLVRIAERHCQAQRQVRDVGKRAPEADRKGSQRREDALLERPVELHALAGAGALRAR